MKGKPIFFLTAAMIILPLLMGGCSSLGPARQATDKNTSLYIAPTRAATPTPKDSLQSTSATNNQPLNCTNQLSYMQDLTYPDGTYVDPGSSLDKQWQVKNDGTCNWDSTYSLHLINGDALGASDPQAIVPARGGTEAVIQISFTAPQEPGKYTSSWQAYGPDGQPFGDYFSLVINVISK